MINLQQVSMKIGLLSMSPLSKSPQFSLNISMMKMLMTCRKTMHQKGEKVLSVRPVSSTLPDSNKNEKKQYRGRR